MIPSTITIPIGHGGQSLSLMLLASITVLGLSALTMIAAKLYRHWF